jgi:hypothetical protein
MMNLRREARRTRLRYGLVKLRRLGMNMDLEVQELEERIAPSVTGTGGYEGQPGGQCEAGQNPSGSANPEGTANPEGSANP